MSHRLLQTVPWPAASSLPAGDATLISQLGGDAHVQAFYERRSGMSASAVTDVRGASGFGPSMSPSGTPTYALATGLTFAALTDMHAAANTIFDLANAGSVLWVGTISGANANAWGIFPNSGATGIEALADNGKVGMWTDVGTDTLVALSSTVIAVVVTWDNGVHTATIQVANQTAVSHTVTLTTGSAPFALGCWFSPTGGQNGGTSTLAAIKVDHVVSSTEFSNFASYASAQHGAVMQ